MDTFVPEEADFDTFLTEPESARSQERSLQVTCFFLKYELSFVLKEGESSEDEEGGNPMVARYEDSVSQRRVSKIFATLGSHYGVKAAPPSVPHLINGIIVLG